MANRQIPAVENAVVQEALQRYLNTFKIAAERVVANTVEPDTYQLPQESDSLEQILSIIYKRIPDAKKREIEKKTMTAVTADENARKREYGELTKVDLRSPKSTYNQVIDNIPFPGPDGYPEPVLAELRVMIKPNWGEIISPTYYEALRDFPDRAPESWATPRTPIDFKYEKLGGEASYLGRPISEEQTNPDGGHCRHYTNGSIYWSRETRAHVVKGAIREKWKALGAEKSFLGYPTNDETQTDDKEGYFSHFKGGSIYWTPSNGAHEIHGAIRNKWFALGSGKYFGGYPISDELTASDGRGRVSEFRRKDGAEGSIYWHPDIGAFDIHGGIRRHWLSHGGVGSFLGYPTTDEDTTADGYGRFNNFQGFVRDGTALSIRWYPTIGTYIGSQTPITNMSLKISKITCIDETDMEEGSSDQISGGGQAIDPYASNTTVPPFDLGRFDDGDVNVWDWTFCTFHPINMDDKHWEKRYFALVGIAEIDSGGFPEFLDKLLEEGKKELIKYISTAVGVAIGSSFGPLGTAVGAVVGYVVGIVITEVINWLKAWWQDDIFALGGVDVALPGPMAIFQDGRTVTDTNTITYRGHGGEYKLDYHWALT